MGFLLEDAVNATADGDLQAAVAFLKPAGILATFGTEARPQRRLIAAIIDGAKRVGLPALIGLRIGGANASWLAEKCRPPACMQRNWVPQRELLQSGAVVVFVSHGGVRSTAEAIMTGVPLLVLRAAPRSRLCLIRARRPRSLRPAQIAKPLHSVLSR